jgi:hypothetical protein
MHSYTDKAAKNKTAPAADNLSKQGSKAVSQLADNRPAAVTQRKMQDAINGDTRAHDVTPVQRKENNTGLPDNLKSGIENLSGHSMDNVKVHYNSDKPSQLKAHAYAQGTNIHLAAGQEKHLPHEAWHVVQQKQGRVKPTMQMKGKINVNDDSALEKEADVMGEKAMQLQSYNGLTILSAQSAPDSPVLQKYSFESFRRSRVGRIGGVIGGAVGAVGGTIAGAVTGGMKQGKKGILMGAIEGAKEGYERPLGTLGGIAGGIVGHSSGTVGAIAGGAAGAAKGFMETGDIAKSAAAGFAGLAAGYAVPTAGGLAAGAMIGGALNETYNPRTKIKHTAGHITLTDLKGARTGITNHEVGKIMTAKLSPTDPVTGSATDVNWTWMQFLRNKYKRSNVVRGHLLNHDLGGFGIPANLYPISTKANREHSARVEQPVKHLLAIEHTKAVQGKPFSTVNYNVHVAETNAGDPKNAEFRCSFSLGDNPPVAQPPIKSDLVADKGGHGGTNDNPLENTAWYHGDRKGAEKKVERRSLSGKMIKGNIDIQEEQTVGLTPNQNAKYQKNAGMRADSFEHNFDQVAHCFRWVDHTGDYSKWLQGLVSAHLGNARGAFKNMVLHAVYQTDTYKNGEYFDFGPDHQLNNEHTANNIHELIIDVVRDQLEELVNIPANAADAHLINAAIHSLP